VSHGADKYEIRERIINKKSKKGKGRNKNFVKKKKPAQQLGVLGQEPRSGLPPSAAGPRPACVLSPHLSLSLRDCDDGATAASLRQLPRSFVGPFAGDGTRQVFPPSLLFMLCETEHPNPNLRYHCLMPTNFELSEIIPLSGVHVYTVHPCPSLVPPP